MSYKTINWDGIKGMSGTDNLEPLTVVTGPNDSGKSAFLDALRLAATGYTSIGKQAKKVGEITSDSNAYAVLTGEGGVVEWSLIKGKMKHSGGERQGNIPATVEEFKSLTAAERMALVTDPAAMQRVVKDIDDTKKEISDIKRRLDRPAPSNPGAYDGAPARDIEKELADISLQLSKHREAMANIRERKASTERDQGMLESLQAELNEARSARAEDVKSLESEMKAMQAKLGQWQDKAKEYPALFRCASPSKALGEAVKTLHYALTWVSTENKSMKNQRLIDELAVFAPPKIAGLAPPKGYDSVDELEEGITSLATSIRNAERETLERRNRIASIESRIKDLQHSLSMERAIHGTPLDQEVFEALMERHEKLQGDMHVAKKWESFESDCGKDAVEKSQLAMSLAKKEERLEDLMAERNSIVKGSVAPIENAVNTRLSPFGMPNIKLEVEATARTSSLVIRSGGVAFDALSGSRQVLYGLCLLVAIAERSSAECPVIVAQCAEMDRPKLDMAVTMLSDIKKGNVVLEHWSPPTVPCHQIRIMEHAYADC